MSQENVEVVRRALESFDDDVEAWLETLDPDVRWYPENERHSLVLGREAALRARERWARRLRGKVTAARSRS